MAPTGRSKRWQVWSLDPQSGRWMVVDEGRESAARASAERKMGLAWKHAMIGAVYVALPPGEEPTAEHYDLAVTEDEAPPSDIRLSGTGTILAEEKPLAMTEPAHLSFISAEALPPPSTQDPKEAVGTTYLSLAPPAPIEVERFASDAFVGTVGQVIPVRFGGQIVYWARVKDANVTDDGLTAYVMLEAVAGPDEGDGGR